MAEFAIPTSPPPIPYPVRLDVDYTERRSRWQALFRLPLAIPLLLFLYALQGGSVLAIWIAILLRGRIPRWLFDFQVAVNRWAVRALGYLFLLADGYPPFEGSYAIRYDVEYPDRVSRWRLVIWKFITSLPHLVVLYLLWIALGVVLMIAWFAILFTGRFPRGLHNFAAGVVRWGSRVQAYALSLTDEFPPFSLESHASAGSRETYVICSVIGVLLTGLIVGGLTAAIIFGGNNRTYDVSYSGLLAGTPSTPVVIDHVVVSLAVAADPADESYPFLVPQEGHHFVAILVVLSNDRKRSLTYDGEHFRMKDSDGHRHDVYLLYQSGRVGPFKIGGHEAFGAEMVFELEDGLQPAELRYEHPVAYGFGDNSYPEIIFKFR